MLEVILKSRKVDPELEHRSGVSLRNLALQVKDRIITFQIFNYLKMEESQSAPK